ncbi:MAG: acetyl-CoA carboxylase, carboxyltransferase subunit beta [Nitrospinota bacterium]
MNWFTKVKKPLERITGRKDIPKGLWSKCSNCKEIIYNNELENNLKICPKCSDHKNMSASARIASLLDEGSFVESDKELTSPDPLSFRDTKKYKDRLLQSEKQTGLKDAIITGSGLMNGIALQIGALEFKFQGGSMGSVVGEKIARTFERAIEERQPVVIVSCSGGARMQEGMLSLMQMAKTASAVAKLSQMKLPFISVLADPVAGGVTASYAMLGDIIIAEPGALICFAGPRVIEQTIKETLPENFQRAEFLLEHGFIDIIVHRHQLKVTIANLLQYLLNL